MTAYPKANGFSPANAASAAYSLVYKNLLRQVDFLAIMDCFRVLCWITLAAVPLMLIVKKIKPGKAAPEGAH